MLVLLGPSGCGKSTTLRLIAGLEVATAGRIAIGGVDVTHLPPAERRLSMVFQSYALFPHLSVAENIIFGLRVRRVAAAERGARLDRVATLLGLDGLLARKPSQLSGGQQQRVALGRALIAETPVCLMDEPLSNLDAQLRLEMRREIRSLQQSLGITMVYVTHDQTEAMTHGRPGDPAPRRPRRAGRARPTELYARPATAFTARFIGTPPMNLLTLADGAGGAVIAGTDGPPLLAAPGAGLLLGVRPEDVRLDTGARPRGGRDREERRVPRRRFDRDLRGGEPDPRGARAGPRHAGPRRARPARVEPGRHARVRCRRAGAVATTRPPFHPSLR